MTAERQTMVTALAARINVDIATTIPAVRQRNRLTRDVAAGAAHLRIQKSSRRQASVTVGRLWAPRRHRDARARIGTVSKPLEWSNAGEDQYKARSGQRLYRITKDSSGLPERVWNVVVSGVDADGTNEELVAEAWPPTLEDAHLIAQGWEDEYGRWTPSSE